MTHRFLVGPQPFSIEVKFDIHIEAELFNCFSRLCLILAFKLFGRLPPLLPIHLSFLLVCVFGGNSGIIYECCRLLIARTQRSTGCLRASLLRSDASSISWKLIVRTVVSYIALICCCRETSLSQRHLYLSKYFTKQSWDKKELPYSKKDSLDHITQFPPKIRPKKLAKCNVL